MRFNRSLRSLICGVYDSVKGPHSRRSRADEDEENDDEGG